MIKDIYCIYEFVMETKHTVDHMLQHLHYIIYYLSHFYIIFLSFTTTHQCIAFKQFYNYHGPPYVHAKLDDFVLVIVRLIIHGGYCEEKKHILHSCINQ